MKFIFIFSLFIYGSIPCLLGQTFDISFVGGVEWEKPNFYSITSNDEILVANTLVDSTNLRGFYQIAKLDFDGNILMSYNFGNSNENIAYDVVQTIEGDLFFLGFNGEMNALELYKFDDNLNPIWNKSIGEHLYHGSLVPFEDKIMVVCTNLSEACNLMFDFDGIKLWERKLSDPIIKYSTNRVLRSLNGDVVISGHISHENSLRSDGYLYRISEDGQLLWESVETDTFYSSQSGIREFNDGNLYAVGTKIDLSNGSRFATLSKFNSEGDLVFQKKYSNNGYLIGKDIVIHGDLIFLLCTTTAGVQDIMLLILDIEGNEISKHNLGDNRNDTAEQIKMINSNELLIIGHGVNTISDINLDMKFIKISNFDDISITNELSVLNNTIKINPNPVRSNASFYFEPKIKEGALYNQLGIKVCDIKNSNILLTLDLSPGNYFLFGISHNDDYFAGKIMIID